MSVQNGVEYEISFRAKWLGGSPQINGRFYLSRAATTAILEVPQDNGTPGTVNSTSESNNGPTYRTLQHAAIMPLPGENVTVSVVAEDPDGIAQMTLWRSIQGGAWQSTPMNAGADGLYSATVAGLGSGVVQSYVEGHDLLGATSTFPAEGVDSRALYQVDDGRTAPTPTDTVRFIMTPADNTFLLTNTNLMSNDYLTTGATPSSLDYDVDGVSGLVLPGSHRT